MGEAALERRLLVGSQKARDYVQPDYGRVHHELRRKGMTLMLLWEEHRADYSRSQSSFPVMLRRRVVSRGGSPFRITLTPGSPSPIIRKAP